MLWLANLRESFNTLDRCQTASQVSLFVGFLISHHNHENWYPTNKSDFTVFCVYLLADFRPPYINDIFDVYLQPLDDFRPPYINDIFDVYLQPLDDFRPPSPVTFTSDQMQLLQHLQQNRMNLDPTKLNLLHHLHTQFQLFQAYQMKMPQLKEQVIITLRDLHILPLIFTCGNIYYQATSVILI